MSEHRGSLSGDTEVNTTQKVDTFDDFFSLNLSTNNFKDGLQK
jgi:hypothetical protein